MDIDRVIMSFSESEKIKEGILWASQLLNMIQSLPAGEKRGGEKVVSTLINMIGREIGLAGTLSEDKQWEGIGPHMDKALMMINSGVSQEATLHLSKALSMVTNIGQQSMSFLKQENLL